MKFESIKVEDEVFKVVNVYLDRCNEWVYFVAEKVTYVGIDYFMVDDLQFHKETGEQINYGKTPFHGNQLRYKLNDYVSEELGTVQDETNLYLERLECIKLINENNEILKEIYTELVYNYIKYDLCHIDQLENINCILQKLSKEIGRLI